jgi:hypothetical protein
MVAFEDDDGVSLADSDQNGVCLPGDGVSVSVDPGELDGILAQGDSTPSGATCSKDRYEM